ncbi:MAG: transporter substrate-binding domain-containing protein [Synechococcus sp.]
MKRLNFRRIGQVVLAIGATFLIGIPCFETTPVNARPWADIENSGALRVGVKVDLPPLAWQDESGEWQGFEIEIARQLAQQLLGDEGAVEFVPLRNQERLDAVIDDRVDMAIAQIGITTARIRQVSLTLPYYLDGTAIVVPESSSLSSSLQLSTEAIAVLKGSTAVATLNTLSSELETVGTESYRDSVDALETGRVDGVAADASVMTGWVREEAGYRMLTPLLSGSGLAIALPKGNQYSELRRRVNVEMQELADSGWLEQQAEEWGLP